MLPSSRTSGGVFSERAVVTFSWMPFHCCSSTLTVTPGCLAENSALTASIQAFGAEPSITQTVISLAPPASVFPLSSPPLPHAATPTIMPATLTAAMSLRFTPPSSGMLPATSLARRGDMHQVLPWGRDLIHIGLDQ